MRAAASRPRQVWTRLSTSFCLLVPKRQWSYHIQNGRPRTLSTESAAARCCPIPPISVPRAPAPGAISVHALTRSGYYPNNCLDPQTRDNEQSGAVWPPNARVICPLSVHSGAPPLWSRGELRQTGCHGPNHTQSVSPIVFYVGRHSRGVSTECLVVRTKPLTRVSDRRSKR